MVRDLGQAAIGGVGGGLPDALKWLFYDGVNDGTPSALTPANIGSTNRNRGIIRIATGVYIAYYKNLSNFPCLKAITTNPLVIGVETVIESVTLAGNEFDVFSHQDGGVFCKFGTKQYVAGTVVGTVITLGSIVVSGASRSAAVIIQGFSTKTTFVHVMTDGSTFKARYITASGTVVTDGSSDTTLTNVGTTYTTHMLASVGKAGKAAITYSNGASFVNMKAAILSFDEAGVVAPTMPVSAQAIADATATYNVMQEYGQVMQRGELFSYTDGVTNFINVPYTAETGSGVYAGKIHRLEHNLDADTFTVRGSTSIDVGTLWLPARLNNDFASFRHLANGIGFHSMLDGDDNFRHCNFAYYSIPEGATKPILVAAINSTEKGQPEYGSTSVVNSADVALEDNLSEGVMMLGLNAGGNSIGFFQISPTI